VSEFLIPKPRGLGNAQNFCPILESKYWAIQMKNKDLANLHEELLHFLLTLCSQLSPSRSRNTVLGTSHS
jgi:hypothetical protein